MGPAAVVIILGILATLAVIGVVVWFIVTQYRWYKGIRSDEHAMRREEHAVRMKNLNQK
ncbi:type IV secretory pathway TrbD component [Trueperella bonasi]|uniref:Type IV secretory pathway TrbD component n=1 Tax=Trueperella bonasi TaxID=312286 RepID=A0ABT9NEP6_9ACTO|nr:hypothetical protein [Trueperella bonasi]MDP9805854.1 type IV secretory pathway TrbD component [Trueperella bonasi]